MTQMPTTVFVLCTGRCGSMTLTRACQHFSNYSAGHETRTQFAGEKRFAYAPNHIECDNRLAWLLGRLQRHYGDNAAYVHLTRDKDAVAQSFRKRGQGIIKAYSNDILARSAAKASYQSALTYAYDYVDTVTENIRLFLHDKPHVMEMQLETLRDDFPVFCGWIGAQGDIEAAMAELEINHNANG